MRFQDSSNEGKTLVKVMKILHENKIGRLKIEINVFFENERKYEYD